MNSCLAIFLPPPQIRFADEVWPPDEEVVQCAGELGGQEAAEVREGTNEADLELKVEYLF